MTQRALSKRSESTEKALREYLESTQREREQSDFVIPSEPKILRLVRFKHLDAPSQAARWVSGWPM